jgi:diguanylate cyclase (GGDEF)-like protein/PAS domain S-box-containing protein
VSLFTRIFMLIGLTLLLVAGGELFNGLKLRQERLGEARSDTAQLAHIAELDIDRILDGAHQLLATLAKLPADRGWDERACSVIGATANSDFEYDHIIAVDRSGIIRCSSTNGSKFLGAPMPDMELFNRIVATAGFSVGSYGVGRMSGNEVIRVGYPVVDDAGTVVGAVYAGINLTWLNTAIDQWQLGTTASIDVTDQHGTVIARHPDPQRVGQPAPDNLKAFVSAAKAGTVELRGADGVVRLYGYNPVTGGPSNNLAVFVGRDRDRIFADINRAIWLNGAVVLIGLLLSAAFAAFYIRRVLVRPLLSLLAVAGRWRDLDWTARTGGASGIPEFDRLSAAFDSMAAAVTAQIRRREIAEQTLVAGLERFRFIFESASDGIFVSDAKTGTFIDANDAGCAMFGYSQGELIGRTIEFLSTSISPYTERDLTASLEKGRAGGPQTFEWRCKAKDGHLFWAEISVRFVALAGHEVRLAILRDITERKKLHDRVIHLAYSDTLTALPNRRDFDSVLAQEVARCGRYGRPLSVAMGDIDHFKIVNDTYGHDAGDAVLKELAEFMRKSLRSADYIARWGGEEFTILLPESKLDHAAELLNRLRTSIASHVISKIGRAVTMSFGVTAYAKPDRPDDILKRVDQALYISKQAGRNKVTSLALPTDAAMPRRQTAIFPAPASIVVEEAGG